MGPQAAIDLRIKFLSVFGDSALVINQIKGEWDTEHPNLIPYKEYVLTLIPHFEEVPQTLASTETVTEDPPMKMASFKDARAVIEKGAD